MKYKWKEYSLCDLIEIKHGFAFKGENITSDDNGIVLVTPGNFAVGGGFQESKCKFFNGVYPNDYVLQPDDLIVTMTDLSKSGDTLGYGALVPKSNRTYLHNQRIGLVSINSEELCKKYLYWFMRSQYYQKSIVASASGSVVKHTSPTRIGEIKISLPPQNIQIEIADTLFALDDRITENKKINHHLEQMTQTIFKSWFDCYDPSQPFTNAVQVLGGGTPKTGNESYWNGEIPFFTPKDTGSLYVLSTEKRLSEAGLSNCNSRLYPVNTVFVTARGTVGKLALAGCPMAMNQSCYALVSNGDYGQFYVYHLALTVVEKLKRKANGAVFDAIVTRDFETELVPAPATKEIKAFEDKIQPIFETILNNCKENVRLAELRDTLLPRLMSGELSVADLGDGK